MAQRPEVLYPPPVGARLPPPPAPPEPDGLGGVSPQQVLLTAGAVAVVVAGAASLRSTGWVLAAALALLATAASVRCGRRELQVSEETLAVAAVVLTGIAVRTATDATSVAVLATLSTAFWLLGRLAPRAVSWPVAAWVSAQLAVLAADPPAGLPHVSAVLGTSVAGVLVTFWARRAVSVVALASTVPWWVAGVVEGTRLVWTTTSTATAATAAALLVGAAAALVALRLRHTLRPLLGPRPLVPVLAGVVVGSAVTGVLQTTGAGGVPAAGYLGLVVAVLVAERASPRPSSLVRPAGLALASTATTLAVVHLLTDGRWTALALLLLAAAVPAVLVAARQPADRPGALPVAVACLAGSTLLAEVDGSLRPGAAGSLLLALTVLALAAAGLERHHRAEVPLAVSAVVVGVVAVAHAGRNGDVLAGAGALAVLGAALFGYAVRTERAPARAGGCAALVVAVWAAAGSAGVSVPEAYSLTLAAVLLLYSGHRLGRDESWSSWGPALVVAYGPSVFLALVEPGLSRMLLVVAAATLTTVAGTAWAVRAPFVVGAASLVTVAVGRLAAVLPTPGLFAVAIAGAVLLGVGAGYENRRRQAREAVASLDDMR